MPVQRRVAAAPKRKSGTLFHWRDSGHSVDDGRCDAFAEGVLDRDNLLVQISRTKLDRIDLAVIFRAEVILWHIVIITSEGVGRKLVCCSGRNKWRRRFAIGLPPKENVGSDSVLVAGTGLDAGLAAVAELKSGGGGLFALASTP